MGKNEMRELLADDFELTNKQRKDVDSHNNNAWDKRIKGQLHILYRKLGAIEKVKKRNERDVVDMIIRNERVNNEFYVCPVYNYAIINGKKIGVFDIPYDSMHGLGTPKDLDFYLDQLKESYEKIQP